jgi:hypothetical protein
MPSFSAYFTFYQGMFFFAHWNMLLPPSNYRWVRLPVPGNSLNRQELSCCAPLNPRHVATILLCTYSSIILYLCLYHVPVRTVAHTYTSDLDQVPTPGCFIHIPITTPVVSALKNYYISVPLFRGGPASPDNYFRGELR